MILADTSAWVEYDRATGSAVDLRMTALVAERGSVAVTEPVIMEVVAGARTDRREADLRRLLQRFQLLPVDIAADFAGAARIYRVSRRAGLTPRGLIDCLIVSVAQRHHAALIAQDRDIAHLAALVGVVMDTTP